MAAQLPTSRTPCATALRALLGGDWAAWTGLPADCSVAALEAEFGPARVLEPVASIGDDGTSCARSTLSDAPITFWHDGERVLLVEADLLSNPLPAPPFDARTMQRRDAPFGVSVLVGGEWIDAGRGLALTVTPAGKVVRSLGFARLSLERYLSTLQPRGAPIVPLGLGGATP